MMIYLVTCTVNGMRYIGQHSGSTLSEYWNHNVARALSGGTDRSYLFNAIRKYGRDAFVVKQLVTVGSKEELDYYECKLIKKYKTKKPYGYNLTDGGEGALGREVSPETRQKIKNALSGRSPSPQNVIARVKSVIGNKWNIGRKRSTEELEKFRIAMRKVKRTKEWCSNIAAALKGKKASPETRRKLSEIRKGKSPSPETRKKLSKAGRGRKFTPETIERMRSAAFIREAHKRSLLK